MIAGIDPGRVPRHVAIVMDGNGRWAQQRGSEAHRGSRRGGGGALRHRRGRARARPALDDGVRVLHRELAPPARRGPVPDALQRVAAAAPPRRPERAGRAGPLHRPARRPGAQAGAAPHRGHRGAHRAEPADDADVRVQLRRPGRAHRRGAGDRRRGGGRAARSRRPDLETRRSPGTSTPPTCPTPTSWCARRGSTGSRTTCCGRARTRSSSSPTCSGPTSGASTSSTPCASSSAATAASARVDDLSHPDRPARGNDIGVVTCTTVPVSDAGAVSGSGGRPPDDQARRGRPHRHRS